MLEARAAKVYTNVFNIKNLITNINMFRKYKQMLLGHFSSWKVSFGFTKVSAHKKRKIIQS
jgi:hypothetical protein